MARTTKASEQARLSRERVLAEPLDGVDEALPDHPHSHQQEHKDQHQQRDQKRTHPHISPHGIHGRMVTRGGTGAKQKRTAPVVLPDMLA